MKREASVKRFGQNIWEQNQSFNQLMQWNFGCSADDIVGNPSLLLFLYYEVDKH